jgi:hypothetical protein
MSPLLFGMTVVDRTTISVRFLGEFHAHGLPDMRKMQSIYRYSDFSAGNLAVGSFCKKVYGSEKFKRIGRLAEGEQGVGGNVLG